MSVVERHSGLSGIKEVYDSRGSGNDDANTSILQDCHNVSFDFSGCQTGALIECKFELTIKSKSDRTECRKNN